LRARKGARSPAKIRPGLVLHEADGRFTEAAEEILRDAAQIGAD
jgi:tRNA1(Val) A37 N6-methylase TrmN6